MHISKISRTYSRTISIRKPDGSDMWLKHEMTVEADLDKDDSPKGVGDFIAEIASKEVRATLKEEELKTKAAFQKAMEEPFPGKARSIKSMKPL